MQLDDQSPGTNKQSLKQVTPCTFPVLIMISVLAC